MVLERTVELCLIAEAAHAEMPSGSPAPLYVIGTEVPAPGGEQAGDEGPAPTGPQHVRRLLRSAEVAFRRRRAGRRLAARRSPSSSSPASSSANGRCTTTIPRRTQALSDLLDEVPGLVYEAHSTDYQTEAALAALVRDHFAVLKVGPALTFAYREALFALEAIERELPAAGEGEASRLRETLDAAMLADASHWRGYHDGDAQAQALARAFSFSDRARYYWPRDEVRDAVYRLFRNVSAVPLPTALLSQFLPLEYEAVRAGELRPEPLCVVRHHVRAALRRYWAACAG